MSLALDLFTQIAVVVLLHCALVLVIDSHHFVHRFVLGNAASFLALLKLSLERLLRDEDLVVVVVEDQILLLGGLREASSVPFVLHVFLAELV